MIERGPEHVAELRQAFPEKPNRKERETELQPGSLPEGYLDRDVIGYVTSAVHYALSTGQWRNINLADLVRVAERGKAWAETDLWA